MKFLLKVASKYRLEKFNSRYESSATSSPVKIDTSKRDRFIQLYGLVGMSVSFYLMYQTWIMLMEATKLTITTRHEVEDVKHK